MAEAEGESLESWLNKATNPSNRQEDWEYIIGFCDQINKELEGPQIAVRLLAHKIQSPQEWEAIQALTYLGDRISEKVKTKVIELLYSWTVALPEESKIKDAYQMLKRQGIVQSDPLIPMDRTLIPSPPPRPKNPVFDDEEKSKLLAKLLKSKNPDDLQEANKLIKSMVKEDEARIQKVTKRLHTLEEVNNNVKLLNEMLVHYSKEDSSEADKELMKELYDQCETKRRTLFKLASETEDNDSSLGDILQASDNLSRVINSYKKIIEGQVINGEVASLAISVPEGSNPSSNLNTLIDLAELDISSSSSLVLAPQPAPPSSDIPILPPPPRSCSSSQTEASPGASSVTNSLSLLDEELLCLGLADPAPSVAPKESTGNSPWNLYQVGPPAPGYISSTVGDSSLYQLDVLNQLLEETKGPSGLVKPISSSFHPGVTSPIIPSNTPVGPPVSFSTGSGSPLFQPLPFQQGSPLKGNEVSLTNVHVPLESIKPSSALPVTAYDKNGFRILFHFAKECPPGRPDVLVVVVSMLNTAPLPVKSIVLQAAVPKSMKVKLQPPSGIELSPFNPIQPPAAITQVMLLANPLKEKVRLRYRLTFALGDQLSTEVGEVDQFPPVEQWGNL
ncbi:ADP-ribosylation factor-binding protein GGA3 isoform X7 [Monodelphis domestica]|uniref:ADP-ribosylation factor-binding protein GGA3 isoform X7 n=1 Tax=Monodelphis domestica TaxID=13616 RepID=UPI0024E26699|nr:ADP-ribosylation factor-binding protein GGA3 isoform X7 [Monodelphis domestica]